MLQRTFSPARKGPMITAIMGGETPEELIAQVRGAEFDGADGICIDLAYLKPEFRTKDHFKRIIGSACLPFMFYFYRNDIWKACATDESRQEILLLAAEAGASCIDVMGDLYDPSPRERTYSKDAIARQRELIDKIHERGSEVVMSSHMTSEALSCEECSINSRSSRAECGHRETVVANTEEDSRGNQDDDDASAHAKKPFIHLVGGKYMRFHRFIPVRA